MGRGLVRDWRSAKYRSPYVFTEGRFERWVKQGRGRGEEAEYLPWLQTRNVKSKGRKHRLRGILHDRIVHLMSDLERNAFFHFERRDGVVDIQEQFPLDRVRTRQIAWDMGVRHPRDPVSGCDIVMTTNLLVTFRSADGRLAKYPFSVKQSSDLLDMRSRDKQEIERRYWLSLGRPWKPLLENLLRDTVYFEAIRWARDWFYVDKVAGLDEADWKIRSWKVIAALSRTRGGSLGDFINVVERSGMFGPGEVLSILRHLAARRLIEFDARRGVPSLDSSIRIFSVGCEMRRLVA